MRVLQINNVYGVGSTGKIVQDLHKHYLEQGIESYVYYARGECPHDINVFKISPEWMGKLQALESKITGYMYGDAQYNTYIVKGAIKRLKPDVVHLQCVNANAVNIYSILEYLRDHDIPTVLTFHSEIFYTGGCSHAFECECFKTECIICKHKNPNHIGFFFDRTSIHFKKLKEIYCSFTELYITCVSDWVKHRAQLSGMLSSDNKLSVVNNGLNERVFYRRNANSIQSVKQKYGIVGDYFLFVTPNFGDKNKGGQYFIKLAREYQKINPNLKFVVAGCKEDIDLVNVITIPFTNGQDELATLYSGAKATLLFSRRETYSMITAESLCCGTPVVGFKAGGAESIALKEASAFVEYGDLNMLSKKLTEISDREIDRNSIAQIARNIYSTDHSVKQYLKIYKRAISNR